MTNRTCIFTDGLISVYRYNQNGNSKIEIHGADTNDFVIIPECSFLEMIDDLSHDPLVILHD